MTTSYEWQLPIQLESPNHKSHWAKKYQLDKKHKKIIATYCKDLAKVGVPCRITLIRQAPRQFDYDNFVASAKACVDQCTSMLLPGLAPGRADGDERIKINYKQEKTTNKQHSLKIIAEKL